MSRARDKHKKDTKQQTVKVGPPRLDMMLTGLGAEPVGHVEGIPEPVMRLVLLSGDFAVIAHMPATGADALATNLIEAAAESMRLASGLVVPQSKIVVPGRTG